MFLQRYRAGEYVSEHRDPTNNIGYTVLGIFGEFMGARSAVGGKNFILAAGDVLQLECTINGVQGPPHNVHPVIRGTRYALILNTII